MMSNQSVEVTDGASYDHTSQYYEGEYYEDYYYDENGEYQEGEYYQQEYQYEEDYQQYQGNEQYGDPTITFTDASQYDDNLITKSLPEGLLQGVNSKSQPDLHPRRNSLNGLPDEGSVSREGEPLHRTNSLPHGALRGVTNTNNLYSETANPSVTPAQNSPQPRHQSIHERGRGPPPVIPTPSPAKKPTHLVEREKQQQQNLVASSPAISSPSPGVVGGSHIVGSSSPSTARINLQRSSSFSSLSQSGLGNETTGDGKLEFTRIDSLSTSADVLTKKGRSSADDIIIQQQQSPQEAPKTRPPPPTVNGQIPEFYDDEETGYQYYMDEEGTAQWDLHGYYDAETFEYIYYEDVQESDGTYVYGGRPASPVKLTPEEKRKKARDAVIGEIIDTEEVYVRYLQTLIKNYMEPLVEREYIQRDQKTRLFSNLPSLLGVNEQLLANLRSLKRENDWENDKGKTLGEIFFSTVEYFKMYGFYCSNYPAANQLLKNLQKKDNFSAFCLEVKESSPERLDIVDLLIKPVQRVLKYPLLIEEVQRNTEEDHKDYQTLKTCSQKLGVVANQINESRRTAENIQEVREMAREIEGFPEGFQLIEPNRRYITRFQCRVSCADGPAKSSEIIVFNDVLLQARKKLMSHKLQWKNTITLKTVLIRDLFTDNDDDIFRLELVDGKGRHTVFLILEFLSEKEKEEHKELILQQTRHWNNEELSKARTRWQNFGEGKKREELTDSGAQSKEEKSSNLDKFGENSSESSDGDPHRAIRKEIQEELCRRQVIENRLPSTRKAISDLMLELKNKRERVEAIKQQIKDIQQMHERP